MTIRLTVVIDYEPEALAAYADCNDDYDALANDSREWDYDLLDINDLITMSRDATATFEVL